MAHKLECLNRRDRYMIGDWVLCNGKPYRWIRSDYNRTQKGMEEIADIPLTEDILKASGWKLCRINGETSCEIQIGEFEYYTKCYFDTYKITIKMLGHEITFEYVHQLQHILRDCKLYDLANNFKLKKS